MKQISTRKAAWAVYAVLLALTTITANARTIAWYHLDEVAPGGRLTPSTAILNAVDSTKLRGAPYSVSSSTLGTDENFMPVATNEVPDSVCVYDPVGITTNRNPRSLFFARADTDKPARLGGCIQVASDSSLSLTNVTVELFVLPVYQCEKTGAGFHLCGKQSTGTGKFTYSMSLTDKGIPYVNVYDSGGTLLSNTGANKFKGSDSIMDGRWHHVAFTAESTVETEGGTETTNTVAKLYVDWKLESTVQLGIPLHYVDNAPLYIGTSLMGWYAFGGFIDEVRISDVALVPSQFLRYYDNDTDTRFLVDFEGNIDASVPFPQHVAAGAAEKFPASDGALPTTSADVPNVRIVDGLGNTLRSTNACSLRFNRSCVKYQQNFELEMPEMTVEFFMKYEAADGYAGLLRYNQSTTSWGATPVWNIGFSSTGSELQMRIDTTEKSNQGKTFGSSFFDGKWHHVAVTFQQGETQLDVKVYDNHRRVGEDWKINGRLNYANGSCLGIGTSSMTRGFTGWIDEVRISRGVLPVEEFMRAVGKRQLVIVIR